MTYTAPLADMKFVLRHVIDTKAITSLPAFAELELDSESLDAILEEAARVAGGAFGACRRDGDLEGARLDAAAGGVRVPESFRSAYQALADGGWIGLGLPAEHGGQGLPEFLSTATLEMWNAANMALALNPALTIGAAYAILAHGSKAQIETYVKPMLSGQWSGTMNLTEPHAGSDLSTLKTTATPEGDHFRIRGQKIFITWGDHDLTDNIVHLVLARLPDAPAGTRGISLFIVPKFLVNADGGLGERNETHCVSIEHKLGIHGSPTCVMSFEGAIGYLVGEPNRGLNAMFTMMNEARLKMGLQGLGQADGSYQQALAYAGERVQGRAPGAASASPIIRHPDVQRMLMTQRALAEAMRAVAYVEAAQLDIARHHGEAAQRETAQLRVDLMIPVIKGWMTEVGQEATSLGVQVHGGMGYIEETGAAQWLRDVRIAAIYEGTNGIQAHDLVFRKLARDRGETFTRLLQQMLADVAAVPTATAAVEALGESGRWLLAQIAVDEGRAAHAGAFDFLMQFGYVAGAWQLVRSLTALQGDDSAFARQKRATIDFYLSRLLPRAGAHAAAVRAGHGDWGAALPTN
jgi:alkylation response protein AidB-like acyl-CoA dehydrogenase